MSADQSGRRGPAECRHCTWRPAHELVDTKGVKCRTSMLLKERQYVIFARVVSLSYNLALGSKCLPHVSYMLYKLYHILSLDSPTSQVCSQNVCSSKNEKQR